MATYSEKLKDQRWINLSNQVKSIYGNRCSSCGGEDNLNTHHLIYRSGFEPWDYNINDLTVMCKDCHNAFHKNETRLKEVLMNGRLMFGYEFDFIINIIEKMSNLETNDYRKVLDFVTELDETTIRF